jgi:hypothetical protein
VYISSSLDFSQDDSLSAAAHETRDAESGHAKKSRFDPAVLRVITLVNFLGGALSVAGTVTEPSTVTNWSCHQYGCCDRFEQTENTHCVGNVDIRRRHLPPLLARLLDRPHIPDTQRRPSELCPHIQPPLVLRRSLPIRLFLDPPHERAGEIHLLCMRMRELHDRPDFGVERDVPGVYLGSTAGGGLVDR